MGFGSFCLEITDKIRRMWRNYLNLTEKNDDAIFFPRLFFDFGSAVARVPLVLIVKYLAFEYVI